MNGQNDSKPGVKDNFTDSIAFKIGLIGTLALLLLIPSAWIRSLVEERQMRRDEVIGEIAEKWGASQVIGAAVLAIPYKNKVLLKNSKGTVTYKIEQESVYILPETLNIHCVTQPETLHRGIFDAVVYNAAIKVSGKFNAIRYTRPALDPANLEWDKAKIIIGLKDLKGLKLSPTIYISGQSYLAEPNFTSEKVFNNEILVPLDLASIKKTALDFNFNLAVRGTGQITMLQLGNTTQITHEGNWGNPSFIGDALPGLRKVSASNFSASWKLPNFNRKYPQQITTDSFKIDLEGNDNGLGVKFLLAVDQYQQNMRSAKYAILIILLTFIALFFTEIVQKKKVNFLQYVLIGAAMIIYYTLLLSLSEQVGFNLAYLIASVATITLIGYFVCSLLKNIQPALLLSGILTLFYIFIYVIIQLQDLALLVGSVALFIVVAVLMQVTQRIHFDKS